MIIPICKSKRKEKVFEYLWFVNSFEVERVISQGGCVISDLKAITSGRKIDQYGWWGCFKTYVSSGVSQKSFYSLFGKAYNKNDTSRNTEYWYK